MIIKSIKYISLILVIVLVVLQGIFASENNQIESDSEMEEFKKIIEERSEYIGKEVEKLKSEKILYQASTFYKSGTEVFDTHIDVKLNPNNHHDKKNCCTKNVQIERFIDQSKSVLHVFMSFKLQDNIWLSLDQEMRLVGGRFVIKGMPSNDLKKLVKKIYHLREIGVVSPIDLNPIYFDKYNIDLAPSFLVIKSTSTNSMEINNQDAFCNEYADLISGNITLAYALQKLSEFGDLRESKELYTQLTGIKVKDN